MAPAHEHAADAVSGFQRGYDRWKTTDPAAEEADRRAMAQERSDHRAAIRALGPKAERLYWQWKDHQRQVARAYRGRKSPLMMRVADRVSRGACPGCGFTRLPLPADNQPGRSYHGPPRCGCPDSRGPF